MAVFNIRSIHLHFQFFKDFQNSDFQSVVILCFGNTGQLQALRCEVFIIAPVMTPYLVTVSLNTEPTCLATARLEPRFSKSLFKSDSSFLIRLNAKSNLLRQSRAKLINSSLDNFLKQLEIVPWLNNKQI